MKSIVLDQFARGIDRRRARSLTEANRLWRAKNVYLDSGGRLRVRFGVQDLGTPGSPRSGLFTLNGTPYTVGVAGLNTPLTYVVIGASGTGNAVISRTHLVAQFNNTWYAVVEYGDASIAHWYNGVRVTDANCPNTTVAGIAGNRVWCATTDGRVRYSEFGNPANWTPAVAETAPGSINAAGQMVGIYGNVTAIAQYRQNIAFFFETGVQLWVPGPNQSQIAITQRINNVGTKHKGSVLQVGDDLIFLAADMFRSLTLTEQNDRQTQADVGAPIKDLCIGTVNSVAGPPLWLYTEVFPRGSDSSVFGVSSLYVAGQAQAWFAFPAKTFEDELPAGGAATSARDVQRTTICVYNMTVDPPSWTTFNVPGQIESMGQDTFGNIYLQTFPPTSRVYQIQPGNAATDGGVPIPVELDWPFLDLSMPGGMKRIVGMDSVSNGALPATFTSSFLFDPNDETRETTPQEIALGDSRPRGLTQVELSSTLVAPRIRYSNQAGFFSLARLQFYYDDSAGPV